MKRGPGQAKLTSGLGLIATLTCCGRNVTSVGSWLPPETNLLLEAESGELHGFTIENDSTASKAAFIQPAASVDSDTEPGEASARYAFTLDNSARLTIWGKIRSPDVNSNRFWIRVDDGTWFKWRITVGDTWYWDDFHNDAQYGRALEFDLDAGMHDLWLANCTHNAALDQIYISSNGAPDVKQPPLCNPPHSIELGGECFKSCGSQRGTQCGVAACAGKNIVESYDCDVCCTDTL